MSFFRPESARFLKNWAEPAIYVAVAIFFGVKGVGLLASGAWVGAVLAVIGLIAIFAFYGAVTRAIYARRTQEPGPGIVHVLEGRITYLGPLGGAVMARDALVTIDIVTNGSATGPTDMHWVLSDESQQKVAIPCAATDAEKLLDSLSVLPGFDHDAVVQAMKATGNRRFPIWLRDKVRNAGATNRIRQG